MKKVLIIVGIIAALGLVGFFIWNGQAQKVQAASKYQTEPAKKGTLTGTVGATGTVRANQSAVITWQTNGTVETVDVVLDQQVNAGDKMANLKSTSLSQNIILAEADYNAALQALDNARNSSLAFANAQQALLDATEKWEDAAASRRSYNGEITVYKKVMTRFGPRKKKEIRNPTEREMDKVDARLAVTEAKLEDAQREFDRLKDGPDPRDIAAAEARVAAAQATINLARIEAPFNGTITDVSSKPGDIVAPGVEAFRMDDLTHLYIDVEISEVDINRIKVGQDVTLTFDGIPNKEYQGKVSEVGRVGTVTSGVVNYAVTVELLNMDSDVLPLMTAGVNIVTTTLDNVLMVPNRAVRLIDGKHFVFVVRPNIVKPKSVEIQIGSIADNYAEVTGGNLKEGDLLVLNPSNELIGGGGFGPGMMGGGR